jgi:hypothetical protein
MTAVLAVAAFPLLSLLLVALTRTEEHLKVVEEAPELPAEAVAGAVVD